MCYMPQAGQIFMLCTTAICGILHLRCFLNILSIRLKVNERSGGCIATILLTGGTGFVGSHAVEWLSNAGHKVRCIVRPKRPSLGWLADSAAEICHADLTEHRELATILDGVDAVVHIAGVTKARSREEYHRGNVETTKALARAAIDVGTVTKFIHMSSTTAVGPSLDGEPITEATPPHPITAYGRSKLEAERFIHQISHRTATVILRPPAVYGPRDSDILELFRWVNRGIRPILGSKRKMLSLIHARDLAACILAVLDSSVANGKTYHVANALPYRVSDIFQELARIRGGRTIPLLFPRSFVFALAAVTQTAASLSGTAAVLNIEKARDLLQPHWTCSAQKLRAEVGFVASIPLETGLRETWHWYKQQGWL